MQMLLGSGYLVISSCVLLSLKPKSNPSILFFYLEANYFEKLNLNYILLALKDPDEMD